MSVDAAKEVFFKSDHFAIVGASKDHDKIGNKVSVSLGGFTFYEWPREAYHACPGLSTTRVTCWYKEHGFDAIPIHPRESSVEELQTVASVYDIRDPTSTSMSIITPPRVTLQIVKAAILELGIAAVWLQPGAEDDEVKAWVDELDDCYKNRIILGGPCILVDGEQLAKDVGKI